MPVVEVTPGVVRNLLKTVYYLRVPHQEVNEGVKRDRHSQTIPLPPGVDVEIFWQDFDAVEPELDRLDRANIVRIIRRPIHSNAIDSAISVKKDNVDVVLIAKRLNFSGNVLVSEAAGLQADVKIATGTEIHFSAGDWVNDRLTIIASGAPSAGQIGPHRLPTGKPYVITTYKNVVSSLGGPGVWRRDVGLDVVVNQVTGVVVLGKAPVIPGFDGSVVISYVVP